MTDDPERNVKSLGQRQFGGHSHSDSCQISWKVKDHLTSIFSKVKSDLTKIPVCGF